jgi:hypothetical protein
MPGMPRSTREHVTMATPEETARMKSELQALAQTTANMLATDTQDSAQYWAHLRLLRTICTVLAQDYPEP